MRRGGILGLRWEHIDLEQKTAVLPMTKNGSSRKVPSNDEAVSNLSAASKYEERPLLVTDVAFRQAWDRLRKQATITDLTLHDLLHKTISRMFDRGMKIHEVMAESGHRTTIELFIYIQTNSIL